MARRVDEIEEESTRPGTPRATASTRLAAELYVLTWIISAPHRRVVLETREVDAVMVAEDEYGTRARSKIGEEGAFEAAARAVRALERR